MGDRIRSCVNEAQSPFTDADGGIKRVLSSPLGGVCFNELDGDIVGARLLLGDLQHAGTQIYAGDLEAEPGELDRMTSGTTPHIEECHARLEAHHVREELHFDFSVLGERILVVVGGVLIEELFPGRFCHGAWVGLVVVYPLSPAGTRKDGLGVDGPIVLSGSLVNPVLPDRKGVARFLLFLVPYEEKGAELVGLPIE